MSGHIRPQIEHAIWSCRVLLEKFSVWKHREVIERNTSDLQRSIEIRPICKRRKEQSWTTTTTSYHVHNTSSCLELVLQHLLLW
jgi:hypothetical protein